MSQHHNLTGSLVSNNNAKYTFTTSEPNNKLQLNGENADIVINGKSLSMTLEAIQERLLILEPDTKKLEKYAALKKAYEQYKLLEKLLTEKE